MRVCQISALLFLMFVFQGCNTIAPYCQNMDALDAKELARWMTSHGFYREAHTLAYNLSGKQKAIMEREKNAVEVKGAPKSELLPEVYRKGYRDGYAYCVATQYLHCRWIIIKKGHMLHLFGNREMTPLQEAYVQGWDAGQSTAFFERVQAECD